MGLDWGHAFVAAMVIVAIIFGLRATGWLAGRPAWQGIAVALLAILAALLALFVLWPAEPVPTPAG